jgi:hypothetical protein
MKYLERRRRIMRRDTVEIIPVAADSAVIVQIEPAKRQRGKLRNRARRKQGDGDPFGATVLASNASDGL